MNKLIHPILILLTGLLLASCLHINGSGYSELTESEKEHVKKCVGDIRTLRNDGNLYQVTVEQVKDYLRKEEDVLVYEYLPFCPYRHDPMEVQKRCDEMGLKCLVIASVYDKIFPIPTSNTFPMLVIDHKVYGTDNYQKYSNQFYRQLTGSDDKIRKGSSYHLFRNGKYIRSLDSLRD